MKDKIDKLLHPHWIVLVFGFLFIILSMGYVFFLKHYNEWISYVIYFLCAYFFTIICLGLSKNSKNRINKIIDNNKYLKIIKEDPIVKTLFALYRGLTINGIYALFKLITGIYYHSIWFVTFGLYYLLIGSIRYRLTSYTIKNKIGDNIIEEYKKYRFCGIFMLFLNLILSGMICLVIIKNQTIHYAGYLIYVMAIYTFYIVINGIINIVKYRKYKSPVMSSVRVVNFIQALISMLSLEIAMLTEFGSENNEVFNRIMIGLTGEAISIIIVSISIYMILKSNKNLKKNMS